MQAGRLLMDGMRQAQVAREVGVTRKAVSLWNKQLIAAGLLGLEGRPRGRPAGLSEQQRRELHRLLMNGALAQGFATELWTVRRVRQLIEEKFSRRYSESQVHRILVGLGFSSQAPTATELRRDGAVIRRWKLSDAAQTADVEPAGPATAQPVDREPSAGNAPGDGGDLARRACGSL
jgi:transposase